MNWRFHHKKETESTNIDARKGTHGDVYTADYQTCGRGRLDHKWFSPPGQNLLMSVVLDVKGIAETEIATVPLFIGLSVAKAVRGRVKWPNDVYVAGRKVAGILCERVGDKVIAGMGVNLGEQIFPPEIAASAGFVTGLSHVRARDNILSEIAWWYGIWKLRGFAYIHSELANIDLLKGRTLTIRQTDADKEPITGFCKGIAPDGALIVGDRAIYAGEANIGAIR